MPAANQYYDETQITFTRDLLKRFRVAYQEALDAEAEAFMFEGAEFVVGYAKYRIEYLEGRLNPDAAT